MYQAEEVHEAGWLLRNTRVLWNSQGLSCLTDCFWGSDRSLRMCYAPFPSR